MCSVRGSHSAYADWYWRIGNGALRGVAAIAASLLLISGSLPAFAEGEEQEITDPGEDDANSAGGKSGNGVRTPSQLSSLVVEGLVLRQSDLPNIPFTGRGIQSNAPTPFVPFTTGDLGGNDFAPAIRGTLRGEMFGQNVEFSAFFMAPVELEATKINLGSEAGNAANTNAVFHLENDPGADINSTNSENIYALTAHYQTKLLGGEMNILEPLGIPGLLIGGRAIYFGEGLGATVMEETDDFPGQGSGTARDMVSVRTDNRLLGLQAGLQGMFDLGDGLRVGGNVKAGIYDNSVYRRRTFFSLNQSSRNQDSSDDDHVVSYGVEANPRVEFKLSDSVFLTASGTFLWLGNVSQAADQYANITDLDDHDLRANRDVYFYGGSLGLTFLLDNAPSSSGALPSFIDPVEYGSGGSLADVDERILELEETTARKGNSKVTIEVTGWINRMILAWNDGRDRDAYLVDNTASRSRFEFSGYTKIARGWSAGYLLGIGIDDVAANDVDQLDFRGEHQIELRHSAWWIRNSLLGTATVGLTSTATDDIILNDVGGIMPGAANISTIGGSLIVRHTDEYENGDSALITRTTLDDFAGGASVDTLRRNVIRYDMPRYTLAGGKLDLSAAWGEDDFYDVAAWYRINWNEWKFRGGVGYLRDTTEGRPGGRRDRDEIKGSASLLHVPSGLFGTAAYVHREFHGFESSDQTVYGENTTGIVTAPGSNRPPMDYLYTAAGLRRGYSSIGDTTVYGEFALVDDAITGLNEAGITGEVTDSKLTMFGAAICQNIDSAAMDLYAGFRLYNFDTEGVRVFSGVQRYIAEPLADISLAYTGARIKF